MDMSVYMLNSSFNNVVIIINNLSLLHAAGKKRSLQSKVGHILTNEIL